MISVIVPVYKVEPYLRQCVNSILNQTYRDIEVLLIDDGSPDRCGEICDEYTRNDQRIRVFHTENKGLSAARNLGLSEAKGEYIGFVDSDDWIEPDMYEVLLKRMQETRADIGVCGYWEEDEKREIVQTIPRTNTNECIKGSQHILKALIERRITDSIWNKLYCADLFVSFRFPEGKVFEDISSMHLIMMQAKQAVVLPKEGYHYRHRTDSITKIHSAEHLLDCAYSCLSRYFFFQNEMPSFFQQEEEWLLGACSWGICYVWRWWYGCSKSTQENYKYEIEELKQFSRSKLSPFMSGCIPWYKRVALCFMRSSNKKSFVIMYYLNQLYIKQQRRCG